MTTYTKETALYNTNAIETDIENAHDAYKSVVTEVGTTGVKIHPSGQSGANIADYTLIDDDGLEVFDGGESVAAFGEDGARIGKAYDSTPGAANESHVEIDYHSMQLIDKEGNKYLHVSDLREANGRAEIVDRFYGDGTTKTFTLTFGAYSTDYVVEVDESVVSSGILKSQRTIVFDNAPQYGAVIEVTYYTVDADAKAFTFGARGSGNIGALSVSMGRNCVSSGTTSFASGIGAKALGHASSATGYMSSSFGDYSHAEGWTAETSGHYGSHAEGYRSKASGHYGSHAEGYITTASGSSSHTEGSQTTASGSGSHAEGTETTASGGCSHAEGIETIASGYVSHAEGHGNLVPGTVGPSDKRTTASGNYGSHAEGYMTTASGNYGSHAEGNNATASGADSHAQNYWTIAASAHQTALGKYNVEDSNDTYAFIVGNGTADNARSNALAVTWDGSAILQGWAGIIQMFAGTTPPAGWLLCDGSAVSRTTYAVLFAAIGTTWGSGDGSTTFNLPDLRGRAPIGAGTGSGLTARTLGGTLGSENIQAHTHSFTQPTITAKYKNDTTASGSARRYVQDGTQTSTTLATASGGAVGAVSGASTGSAGNMQPSAVVNFIIHTGKTS